MKTSKLSQDKLNTVNNKMCSISYNHECFIEPYIYARKNKHSVSLIFRADVRSTRIVKKIGNTSEDVTVLNQRLSRLRSEVSYLRGEAPAPLTLSRFINTYYIPHSETNHRDHKGMLSRLKILSTELEFISGKLLSDISKFDCIQVINRLRLREVSASTLNKYRYALQAVFSLAVEMELIDRNPVEKIKKEVLSNTQTRVLRGNELHRFTYFSSSYSNPYSGSALLFLLFTGMRSMEALTMKWTYLSEDKSYVDLPMTKSGKARRVHINETAKRVLVHLETLKMNEFVFYSPSSKGHLTYPRNALQWVCTQLSKEGVLKGQLTLHSLRHTFATNLIETTGSLRATQIALGHSSRSVTERYTHLSNEHISNSVKQLDSTFNYMN
ncbi:site-specific integrase [Marinomonas arenicola]|uniref:Site-specific integrase n=1 Tax=Marinomonas arenicola TaxID=569601 RepID=A0ABU9G8N0_9GAMM